MRANTATPSANWWPAAASWTWWWWRAPIRTPAHQDVYDAHPDWIAVDAAGKKRRHWAMPELWVTCALGPYNFEFMTEVTREIVTRYKVDGIFSNRWAGSGMCYCEHCRENFSAAAGLDLPRTHDPQDPSRRAYIGWRQQRLFELWRLWDSEIRRINPSACYIPNYGRRRAERSRHEDGRRAGAHAVRRPPGAPRTDGAVGEWQERQGVPLHHGEQARGRHLQRGRGGAVPLEGFGAGRRRRSGCGRSTASPTDCVRGSPNSRARSTTAAGCRWWRSSTAGITATSAICVRSGRWRASAWCIRSRPRNITAASGRSRRWKTTRWAITRR